MSRLVRAEFRKLSTVRTFKGLIAGAVVFSLVRFTMIVVSAGKIEAAPLGTAASTKDMLLVAGAGTLVFLVIGVLSVSTEVRHGTIDWTFLTTPDRWRVLASKIAAVVLLSVVYLIAMSGLLVGLTAVVFSREGIPFGAVVNAEMLAVLGGVMVGLPLYAALGVGLGALIPNQIASLMIPLAWVLVVETLLPSFGLMGLMAWMPGGATASLGRADMPGLLPMWAGALLMIGYAAAAVAAGGTAMTRRDFT
jgi:ABC-2 type transport system permease protein